MSDKCDDPEMLRLQYELSAKNIAFLDAYIPRSLALFIALSIGFIAIAKELTAIRDFAELMALFILVVALLLFS